jgi:hypothetical protein
VGKGTLKASDLPRIMEARSRSAAGATAPASGLCLVSVRILTAWLVWGGRPRPPPLKLILKLILAV